MKRVGGKVTWLCEFEPRLADLAARGLKSTTLRRCHIVEAGDTLRLSTGGSEGVFAEVEVRGVTPITVEVVPSAGAPEFFICQFGDAGLSEDAFDTLAEKDGFDNGRCLLDWLLGHGKIIDGKYEGQLIEW